MCNCNCNNNILTSTASVASDGGLALITPTITLAPENEERLRIKITNSVPQAAAALPVAITLNGGNVFVYNRFGNIVYGNELYEGMVIKGYYGNNGYSGTGHYQLIRLPRRCYCYYED